MTTLNKTLEELKFEFSGIGGILHDAFSVEGNKLSSIKNSSNTNSRKRRYDNIKGADGGVDTMTNKFKEAENELLKKSSAQIISAPTGAANDPLAKYQNNLPYGVSAAGGVNQELYAVHENTWAQFSKDMGKIFQKVGKQDQLYKASFNAMTSQNSALKPADIENMVYSTCGSLSEWPQINPKSAGLGKCSKLFEVFSKHYKRYSGKIEESNFYSDLMSSLHTCEVFALSRGITGNRNTTGIQGFSSEVKVYNIDTSLWFPSDEIINGKEAKYKGFLKEDEDSYGTFFDIGGFPIRYQDYVDNTKKYCIVVGTTASLRNTLTDREYSEDDTAIKGRSKKIWNGMYSNYSTDTNFLDDNSIVVAKNVKVVDAGKTYDVNKRYCMLYKYEGDRNDINKLKEIQLPKLPLKTGVESTASSYLFNVKTELPTRQGYFITTRYNIKDTIITQSTIALIELYVIKNIFGFAYPQDNVIPIATLGGRQHPNIFQVNNLIVGAPIDLLNDAAYNGSRYVENLASTKSRLLNLLNNPNIITITSSIFGEDFTKFNAHPSIVELRRLINSMDETGAADVNIHINHVANSDEIIGMPVFRITNFNTFYHDLIGAGHQFTRIGGGAYQANQTFNFEGRTDQVMDRDNFVNDQVTPHNRSIPVLAYRFIMRRMVHWYKETYFPAGTVHNTNFSNLYMRNANERGSVTLTQARAQGANYNTLTNFKQAIPDINPIMVGGSSRKSSHNNLIKTGGKKSKIIQKGGDINTLFTGNAPKLYANRKLMNFSPSQFDLALKKYKELDFTADYAKVKSLFDKISQISHLPLFFDGYKDTLNIFTNDGQDRGGGPGPAAEFPESGGCGVVPPNGNTIPLSFSDVAQLFLFNSVNTTTTTLLIHFLKNVKACLNHFITTDLKTANDNLPKNAGSTQFDKIEGSLIELIKEIDKVVNFLKYNTLNLQEQSVRLNNEDVRANPTHQFQNNEHYIKNLFLGANVFFSHADQPNKSVVMRFTKNDGGDARGGNNTNWYGDEFFQFLNRIVGCTENSNIFGNTLKFLTDSNPVNQALQVYSTTPAGQLTAGNNPYLEKIRPYLKNKPDACFGGIPFVSLDPKIFSLLTQSFYLLLGLRLEVGVDVQANDRIEKEIEFSKLAQDKQDGVRKRIQDTLTLSAFSTLAESLKTQASIDKANMMFNTIFRFLFTESQRLIAQVNQAKQEINKAAKVGNKKNSKKGLFTGGGPTSIYTFRKTTNSNQQSSLIKSEINFIKTTYQTSAEFEYMIDQILTQMKKEIERREVRNELHFFYYMDTHFRNFKIYMETYLLTIGENNIPPEIAKKLQDYISYSPDKNKALESYKKLTQVPLIDPRYSDPFWWAKIERKFMNIQKIDDPQRNDCVYRLFIITTTPPDKLKLRDMYIIDAFSLATLNTGRSSDKYWGSTGDRTHLNIRKTIDGNNGKIYLDTNTIIKLTGVGSGTTRNTISKRMESGPYGPKNIDLQIRGAIKEDIRDLICGKFKYFDKSSKSLKTLIPIFLQGDKNDILKNIVNRQKDDMFENFRTKFKLGTAVDYRIYQISDDHIKDLKKYRQWLYSIFIEQQMKLKEPELERDKFNFIEKTMISSFSGKFFQTDITGKCSRIYNIYDYIVLQSSNASENVANKSKKMVNFRNTRDQSKKRSGHSPALIQEQKIRYPDPNFTTVDFGAEMIAGFISRESLIKLMLIY
jgi:hypothetical protein